MKSTFRIMAWLALVILIGGSVALIVPGEANAQVVCSSAGAGDADGDGFTDLQECTGITTVGSTPLTIPRCAAGVTGDQRNLCMDPNTKDMFIILVKATGSLIDTYLVGQDPLAILKKTAANGGLGIAVHSITPLQAGAGTLDRFVTSTQKAVRITESLDESDIITGFCNQGTPNGLDGCFIWTKRIANLVTGKCPSGVACILNPSKTGVPVNSVIALYIQNTIAHESSHSMGLTATYDSRYGGNHYMSDTNGVVMDQSVFYDATSKTKTIFYLPGVYAAADPRALQLK